MKHEDIGEPAGFDPDRRDRLIAQLEDELCDKAVAELLDESVDIYLSSTENFPPSAEGLREVLKNAYKKWDVSKTE